MGIIKVPTQKLRGRDTSENTREMENSTSEIKIKSNRFL
jgi:hypothetical protein